MNNAELLLQINKFYQEQQIPISAEGREILNELVKHANNHLNEGLDIPVKLELEKHINRLINNVAERFNQVIDAHIEQYKNHVERGLNLNEEQMKNLEFLATVGLKIARSGLPEFIGRYDLPPTISEQKRTQIKRAAKMLGVTSGGENFFYSDNIDGLRMQTICPTAYHAETHSIPEMIELADRIYRGRCDDIASRAREAEEKAKIASGEAPPPYEPPAKFNGKAFDNSAIYEILKISLMVNANLTRTAINHWTVFTYSNPAYPGAQVIRYEHNNGVAQLVMVRHHDSAQLNVQVSYNFSNDKRDYLQSCSMRGDLISDLEGEMGENSWMNNGGFSFVSKGMSKAVLSISLSVFAKYFDTVNHAPLPVEHILQHMPEAGTNVPFILMARPQEQEANNNNNNNNNNNKNK